MKQEEQIKIHLSKKKILTMSILLIIVVFVIWMFHTGGPSEKTYSHDGQYSYYTAVYNFNKIRFIAWWYGDFGFGACTPCMYKRKVFLYDEIEKKIINSGYGGSSYSAQPAFFSFAAFTYCYGNGDSECHEWILPRPLKKLSKTEIADLPAESSESVSPAWVSDSIVMKDTIVGDFRISNKIIESSIYYEAYNLYYDSKTKVHAITDDEEVMKMLGKIVAFKPEAEYYTINPNGDSVHHISIATHIDYIRCKNGETVYLPNEENYFKAYYPDENVFLCEGIMGEDIVYDLRTGMNITQTVGNPSLYRFSSGKKFRLNGYYDGNDCGIIFLDFFNESRNIYEKMLRINDPKLQWNICGVLEAFWINDHSLYYKTYMYSKEGREFSVCCSLLISKI